MAAREVLLLGDERLYQASGEVSQDELNDVEEVIADLHDTLMSFRGKHGYGRAIAAPQIGVFQRIVYLHIDQPTVMVNPRIEHIGEKKFEVWDDCMCFPGLKVKVLRHRKCRVRYKDQQWHDRQLELADDLSELLQHECDHLDGVLAVQKAVDDKSFKFDPAPWPPG
jgi:peptide deformylase